MDGWPRKLLEAALPELERVAQAKRVTALKEHDLQQALEARSGASSASIPLKHWPQVGPFDLVIDARVGIELQWCQSGDGLAGCAWDIAKLATASAERKISEAWLIAAAPAWHWDTRRPGVELLRREHSYVGDELVEDYEDWWRLWCNEVTSRPTHLPQAFAVTEPGSLSARIGRVPFIFCFARIEVRKPTWNPHLCPHRWRDRMCLPRPWDLDGSGGVGAQPMAAAAQARRHY